MTTSLGAESERWCIVLVVVERDGSLLLVVEPTRVSVPCPLCGELSRRQHSRYERHPLDLPWRGQIVRMRVQHSTHRPRGGHASTDRPPLSGGAGTTAQSPS